MKEHNKPLLSREELADLLSPLDSNPDPSAPVGSKNTTVHIATRTLVLSREELDNLRVGTIIPVSSPPPEVVNLYVQGQCIGTAKYTYQDNKQTLEICQIDLAKNR